MKKTFILCIAFLSLLVCAYAGVAYADTYRVDYGASVKDATPSSDWSGNNNFTDNHIVKIYDENEANIVDIEYEIQYRKNYLLCRKVDVRARKSNVSGTNILFGVKAYESNSKVSNEDGKMANYVVIANIEVTASFSSTRDVPTYIYGEVFTADASYAGDAAGGRAHYWHLFTTEYED